MKFAVMIDGGYSATIEVAFDANDAFTGTLEAGGIGSGSVEGQRDGHTLKGTVSLDGYDADFNATLNGNAISGTIKYGWFFKKSFAGTQTP